MSFEDSERSVVVTVGDGVLSVENAKESMRAEVSYPVRIVSQSPSPGRRVVTPSGDVAASFSPPQESMRAEVSYPVGSVSHSHSDVAASFTPPPQESMRAEVSHSPSPRGRVMTPSGDELLQPSISPPNDISLITLMDQTVDAESNDALSQVFDDIQQPDELMLPLPTPQHSEPLPDPHTSYVLSTDPEVTAMMPHVSYADPSKSDARLPFNPNTSSSPLEYLYPDTNSDQLSHLRQLVDDIKSLSAMDPDAITETPHSTLPPPPIQTPVSEPVHVSRGDDIIKPSVPFNTFICQYDDDAYEIVCEQELDDKTVHPQPQASHPVQREVEAIVRSEVCSLQTTDSPRSRCVADVYRPAITLKETIEQSVVVPSIVETAETVGTQTTKFTHFVVPKRADVPLPRHPRKVTLDSTVSSVRTNPIIDQMFATPSSHPVTVTSLAAPSSVSSLSNEIRETDHKSCFIVILIFSTAGITLFILGVLGKFG